MSMYLYDIYVDAIYSVSSAGTLRAVFVAENKKSDKSLQFVSGMVNLSLACQVHGAILGVCWETELPS